MEFEEIKKIWDTQNQQTMYAINEEALHNRIRARRRRAVRITNANDFGLIAIALLTAVILLSIGDRNFYDYLSAGALVLIAGYIGWGRIRRKGEEGRFDRSMLGDLDRSIANTEYEIKRAQTFIWWFILPVAVPTLMNMVQAGAPIWKWILIPFAFCLSFALVRWELRRQHLPGKRKLEALREKLLEEG